MNNGYKGTFSSTGDADEMTSLTLKDIQEAYDKVGKIRPRKPLFFVYHLLDEVIVHGEMVDQFMEMNVPGFDKETDKGFLIPQRMVSLIRREFGPMSVVTLEF